MPLDYHESLLNSGILPNKPYNLNTDYLASGWLFCFILQTEYVLKFVYFLLVLIDCSKSLWISGRPSNITVFGTNLVNGELVVHSNIMLIRFLADPGYIPTANLIPGSPESFSLVQGMF